MTGCWYSKWLVKSVVKACVYSLPIIFAFFAKHPLNLSLLHQEGLLEGDFAESVQGFVIAGPAGAGGMLHIDPG